MTRRIWQSWHRRRLGAHGRPWLLRRRSWIVPVGLCTSSLRFLVASGDRGSVEACAIGRSALAHMCEYRERHPPMDRARHDERRIGWVPEIA